MTYEDFPKNINWCEHYTRVLKQLSITAFKLATAQARIAELEKTIFILANSTTALKRAETAESQLTGAFETLRQKEKI